MGNLERIFMGQESFQPLLDKGKKILQNTGILNPGPKDSLFMGTSETIKEDKQKEKNQPQLFTERAKKIYDSQQLFRNQLKETVKPIVRQLFNTGKKIEKNTINSLGFLQEKMGQTGFGERLTATRQSIEQKSLEPLKQSFKGQLVKMNTPEEMVNLAIGATSVLQETNLLKSLIETKTIQEVKSLLPNITDDVASKIAKSTDEGFIGSLLKKFDEVLTIPLPIQETKAIPPIYKGEKDLTTKFLEYAKGKTTLSKQEILDFARRPEIKKGEADLLLRKLEEFSGEQILSPDLAKQFTPKGGMFNVFKGKNYKEVLDFASKNSDYYLPSGEKQLLESVESGGGIISGKDIPITLKNAEGGSMKLTPEQARYFLNAKEGVSKSPKLPAQEFADSMRRDLLELKSVKVKEPHFDITTIEESQGRPYKISPKRGEAKNYEEVVFESPITTNGSSHYPNSKNYFAHARGDEVVEGGKKIWREQEIQSDLLQKGGLEAQIGIGPSARSVAERRRMNIARRKEIEPLQPFTNDRFGERIMRERIKEKASKGYTKYRLPTGETIGKIERFQNPVWRVAEPYPNKYGGRTLPDMQTAVKLSPENIKVGMEVHPGTAGQMEHDTVIITDILDEGRFKAVPKEVYEGLRGARGESIPRNLNLDKLEIEKQIERAKETFDLTGKLNPQYRRYSDWGKFLKNKFGGKEITDPQGNSWTEIDLKKEMAKFPIEAFGGIKRSILGGLGLGATIIGASVAVGVAESERTKRNLENAKKLSPADIRNAQDEQDLIQMYKDVELLKEAIGSEQDIENINDLTTLLNTKYDKLKSSQPKKIFR